MHTSNLHFDDTPYPGYSITREMKIYTLKRMLYILMYIFGFEATQVINFCRQRTLYCKFYGSP